MSLPLFLCASTTYMMMMASPSFALQANRSLRLNTCFLSSFKNNFAPVEEMGHAIRILNVVGEIPADFPLGVYIRNGSNPLFGVLKSASSLFGQTSNTWFEGEGMLHALYFTKDNKKGWIVSYNNRYVETETFKLEKKKNKPCFLPAIERDSPAVLASLLLNMLRFGKTDKHISNTNIFNHSGKYYSIAENHIPQEIDISTLETLNNWDINGSWDRPFTSHPKKAPGTRELVIIGVDAVKPFLILGVVSDDGKKLVHKVDLKFQRSSLCHDIGVTEKYNVIMDIPLTINIKRPLKGGPLIKYDKEYYSRIGVIPRYGDADSIQWFEVEPHCIFHMFNCFEDDDEVVVRGCRSLGSIIPGPDFGLNKFEWFSRGFKPIVPDEAILDNNREGLLFGHAYEWRLNMRTGEINEINLTGTTFSMDFPMINDKFIGYKNKYGYTQVAHSSASSSCGMAKYGMLAKLCFEDPVTRTSEVERHSTSEDIINVEYHKFEENNFCSGATFVPKNGGCDEDDGWIISLVHNEMTNVSQAHIIDTKRFEGEPVAKTVLPRRVPYGFHGAFFPIPNNIRKSRLYHV